MNTEDQEGEWLEVFSEKTDMKLRLIGKGYETSFLNELPTSDLLFLDFIEDDDEENN